VWVERAANYAAKLASLNGSRITWITDTVFGKLAKEAKYGGRDETLMWDKHSWTDMGNQTIYGSNWTWAI